MPPSNSTKEPRLPAHTKSTHAPKCRQRPPRVTIASTTVSYPREFRGPTLTEQDGRCDRRDALHIPFLGIFRSIFAIHRLACRVFARLTAFLRCFDRFCVVWAAFSLFQPLFSLVRPLFSSVRPTSQPTPPGHSRALLRRRSPAKRHRARSFSMFHVKQSSKRRAYGPDGARWPCG